jgi:Uma2 family endonuclease
VETRGDRQAIRLSLECQLPDRVLVHDPSSASSSQTPAHVAGADLAVFESDTVVEQDGYVHSAPQLVVEVLSPANTRREREEKIADYARIGVPEVWVVSPEGGTVEILNLAEGYLRSAQVLREGVLTPVHFPGVHVEIARIWPE